MSQRLLFLSTVTLLFATCATSAAEPPAAATPESSKLVALPPPGINDPGVTTAPMDAADSVQPSMPDTRPVREKSAREADMASAIRDRAEMTRRQEGDDTVEEYREKGILRMIRIVPPYGPVRTYMDQNQDGRLDRDPGNGPVSPVYFTIYEWN